MWPGTRVLPHSWPSRRCNRNGKRGGSWRKLPKLTSWKQRAQEAPDTLTSTATHPESPGGSSAPAWGMEGRGRYLGSCLVPLVFSINILLHTPCIFSWGSAFQSSVPSLWNLIKVGSVQSLSCVWLFATPWTAARQAFLSSTNSRSPSKTVSIESVMPSNHLILCRPLLFLPPIFPSFRVFSNESALRMRWPKDWSFSFNISPSKEHPGLISFRMDWLDLLAAQWTLKSLLQHHSSKASILLRSAFFIVQLSHPYLTTGKTIALTRQTFVGKVMSLIKVKLILYFDFWVAQAINHFSLDWEFLRVYPEINVISVYMLWKLVFTSELHLTLWSPPAGSAGTWLQRIRSQCQDGLQHVDPWGALHGLPCQAPASLGLMLFPPGPGEAIWSFMAFSLPPQPPGQRDNAAW